MSIEPVAPGRLSGAPVAIVDIGSNSVRLVAYEALTRSPTPHLQRKGAVRPRSRRGDHGPARGRGDGQGYRRLAMFPHDVPDDADRLDRCDRHRRHAGRAQRRGFLGAAREAIGVPIALIDGLREAELSAMGVRRRRTWRGRRCRRSRRRIAGTGRHPRVRPSVPPCRCRSADWRSATCRRTRPGGRSRSCARRYRARRRWRVCAAAPSMPSAAHGGRSRGCTWSSAVTPSTSCRAT